MIYIIFFYRDCRFLHYCDPARDLILSDESLAGAHVFISRRVVSEGALPSKTCHAFNSSLEKMDSEQPRHDQMAFAEMRYFPWFGGNTSLEDGA